MQKWHFTYSLTSNKSIHISDADSDLIVRPNANHLPVASPILYGAKEAEDFCYPHKKCGVDLPGELYKFTIKKFK